MTKHISDSVKETNKIARELAKKVLIESGKNKQAVVVGLSGELGSGKTTFTKSFAKTLGIKERVKSPTFAILKRYRSGSKNLVHIDAYRLIKSGELLALGWKNLIKDPENIILVEWADNVKKIFPPKYYWVELTHQQEHKRGIDIKPVK